MTPVRCAAPLKLALKASRSPALRGCWRRGPLLARSSQEPWASITRPARTRRSAAEPTARSSTCQAPAQPWKFCTCQGCSTSAPSARARSSRSKSSVSRPSARPQRRAGSSAAGKSAVTTRSPRCSATRCRVGPARASTASATPSMASKGRLLAAMHSPHTLRRGKGCFSTRATDHPARASRMAVAEPAGPAPTISASKRARGAAAITWHPRNWRRMSG